MTRPPPPGSRHKACFTTGSIMRHVLVMAGTGAIGLMAVFAVDMLNMVYISHLNNTAMTAAIGFASAVIGLQIAISIGLTIGISAATAREIGAGRHEEARCLAASSMIVMTVVTGILGLATAMEAAPILHLFGAQGQTLTEATAYLRILSVALPLICVGMGCSALCGWWGMPKAPCILPLWGPWWRPCWTRCLFSGCMKGL